jgi:hypothetical protein
VPDRDESVLALAPLLRAASRSGPVLADDEGGFFQLTSCVYVHDQVEDALRRTLALAAALQAIDAHRIAPELASATGGHPAVSAAPGRDLRRTRDGILAGFGELLATSGGKPSVYAGSEFADVADRLTAQGFVSSASETGLTAECPFGGFTSLLTMVTAEADPLLGRGLRAELTLPVMPGGEGSPDGVRAALALNAREVTEVHHAHFTGSWHPARRGLAYRVFLPNLLGYGTPGWVLNLALVMTRRAAWSAGVFGREFDPEASSAVRAELWEELAGLGDDEFRALLDGLPAGEDRERVVAAMTAVRDAVRHQMPKRSAAEKRQPGE